MAVRRDVRKRERASELKVIGNWGLQGRGMFGRIIQRFVQSSAYPAVKSSKRHPHIPIYSDVPPKPVTAETIDIKGTNLIGYLRQEQRKTLTKDGRWALFDKHSPIRIHAGSMIKITFKPSTTATKPISFAGVLLAIHRHPSEPTILIRSSVDGLGMEQKFCVMSPLIEKIEVIRPASILLKHKLYLLREQPSLINKFSLPPEDQRRRLEKLKGNSKLHWCTLRPSEQKKSS